MMENFPNLRREKFTQIQETQSPKQEEPKETHCKTHHKQNGKIPKQRKNLKGSKGETRSNIQGSPNIDKQLTSQWKCSKPDENGKKYSK